MADGSIIALRSLVSTDICNLVLSNESPEVWLEIYQSINRIKFPTLSELMSYCHPSIASSLELLTRWIYFFVKWTLVWKFIFFLSDLFNNSFLLYTNNFVLFVNHFLIGTSSRLFIYLNLLIFFICHCRALALSYMFWSQIDQLWVI